MITTATLLSAVPKYIAFAVLAAILALSLIVFRIPAKHYRRPAIVQRENQEMGPVRASVAVMLRRALRSVGFGRQSWSEEALADTYGDEAPYDASDLVRHELRHSECRERGVRPMTHPPALRLHFAAADGVGALVVRPVHHVLRDVLPDVQPVARNRSGNERQGAGHHHAGR